MTQDDETLAKFIEESTEHLDGIESDLLTIEEAGAEIDQDLVNKVFRAVHSIKGSAGFLGLNTVKELAHGAENILNRIRDRVLIPSPEIVNHLLNATDTLTRLLASKGEGNEDISGILAALTSCISQPQTVTHEDSPPAHQAPTETVSSEKTGALLHLFSIATEEITKAVKSGQYVFLIELDLIADVKSKGKITTTLFEELQELGTFLGCRDAAGAPIDLGSDQEIANQRVFILFATILEATLLAQFVDISEEAILLIPSSKLITEPPPRLTPKTAEEKSAQSPPPAVAPQTSSPPQPAAEASPPTTIKKIEGARKTVIPESSLRVNVKILDNLMTLAGELVLTRNQFIQTVNSTQIQGMDNISQRLDLITSELQESIMSTRMQPVGNVFNKFKRIVRDLSRGLGKEIDLIIDGSEVELDKTIIEAIGDPLTHLIRNSVDHGIERPDIREQSGKQKGGTLHLSAFHEGGHVIIKIQDDGAGIDTEKVKEKALAMGSHDRTQLDAMPEKELAKLIFLPGLSTAQKVTDVSGRGVGMDVVNANLARIGGVFDIETKLKKGTTISIKLPLTLAIIPSLIVALQEERYAIPQVNMVELVRIPAAQVKEKIESIGSALVMRLRGDLLPIIHLSDLLGVEERTYTDLYTEEKFPCRRTRIADRRSVVKHPLLPQDPDAVGATAETTEGNIPKNRIAAAPEVIDEKREAKDRRTNPLSAYNILVVAAGNFHYGLIVDKLLDSEEIVVKPLGSHLRECEGYAGATIQGDGKVAFILDVVGISKMMNLSMLSDQMKNKLSAKEELIKQDMQSLLIVKNSPKEQMAVPLDLVSRIEKIKNSNIEITGGRLNIQCRGETLPLFTIDEVAEVMPRDKTAKNSYVVVFQVGGKEMGILVAETLDIVTLKPDIDDITHKQPGIMGSTIIMDKITLLVDLYGIISTLMPDWVAAATRDTRSSKKSSTILIVEDSKFFMNQLCDFVAEAGYTPLKAFDGQKALNILSKESVDLILTDIEMPNMDGLEMTERIRSNPELKDLPIIAVTSVAGDTAEKRGLEAGVNEYMVKLDREKIINAIDRYLF